MNELKDMLTRLAQQQQSLIGRGISPREIAAQKIIDVETTESGSGEATP